MKLMRKLALATAAGVLSVSAIGMVTPAAAGNASGWSCGGWCRSAPPAESTESPVTNDGSTVANDGSTLP